MRPFLLLPALLLPAALLQAQQSTTPPPRTKVTATQPVQKPVKQATPSPSTKLGPREATEKTPLSEDQQTKQDALVKGNPKLDEAIKALEAKGGKVNGWGNTDEAGMKAAGAKSKGKSVTGGNKKAAASAYKRKDYKAALEQYKALAADGDTEAQVMLGIMHEKGQGVDQDKAAAYAYYGHAAEQGDPTAREIVRDMNDKDNISNDELDQAGKKYGEISQELGEPGEAQNSGEKFRQIREETNVNTELYERAAITNEKPAEPKSP